MGKLLAKLRSHTTRDKKPKKNSNTKSADEKISNLFKCRSWAVELGLVLGAVAFMAAITVLLAKFNQQPQPSWRYGISLNTIVAIFATSLRAGLITVVEGVISQTKWVWHQEKRPLRHLAYFDEASRGPWGSILLHFRIPRLLRKNLSALFGCLVLASSIAIVSFTQQAVKPVTCEKIMPGTRPTLSFSNHNASAHINEAEAAEILKELDTATKAAIISALANPSQNQTPMILDCLTGNCTFQEDTRGITHMTAGVCNACVETTSLFKGAEKFYVNSAPFQPAFVLPTSDSNGKVALSPGDNIRALPLVIQSMLDTDWAATAINNASLDSVFGAALQNFTIAMLTKVGCQSEGQTNNSPEQNEPSNSNCTQSNSRHEGISDWNIVSASCALYPCVKDLKASVKSGVSTESTVRSTPIPYYSEKFVYQLLKTPCMLDGILYTPDNISLALNLTTPGDESIFYNDSNVNTAPSECMYRIDAAFQMTLQDFLTTSLPGFCIRNEPGSITQQENWVQCQLMTRNVKTQPVPNFIGGGDAWWLSNLYQSGNGTFESISSTMDAVALAITNMMRVDADPLRGNNVVYGTMYETTVCVQFDWQWLLFPAALIVLTALALGILLVTDITSLDERSIPPWKSSILPMLYFSEVQKTIVGKPSSLHELKKDSDRTKVILERKDREWKIAP